MRGLEPPISKEYVARIGYDQRGFPDFRDQNCPSVEHWIGNP